MLDDEKLKMYEKSYEENKKKLKEIGLNKEQYIQTIEDYSNAETIVRGIQFSDILVELNWPKSDLDCFNIIAADWQNYYNEMIREHVKDFNAVLQAGGAAGLYPLLYGLNFRRVYTFEPESFNFRCLADNCKFQNVFKFNAGLSDKCGISRLKIMGINNIGMNKIDDTGTNEIYTMTIDSLEIEELSLIHLDIEGYEAKAFEGARKTIERCKPVIFSDVSDANGSTNNKTITAVLESMNYKKIKEYGKTEITAVFVPN
jgi:hypothetical protein